MFLKLDFDPFMKFAAMEDFAARLQEAAPGLIRIILMKDGDWCCLS